MKKKIKRKELQLKNERKKYQAPKFRDSKIKELFVQITSEDMYFFFNFDLLIFLENLVS